MKEIAELLRQAKHNEDYTSGMVHLESEWKYWQGRKEALEDVIKILRGE